MKYEQLDSKFRDMITKNRTCEFCDSDAVDVAHIITRENLRLRWSVWNVVMLCRKHHQYSHSNPKFFRSWIERTYPKELEMITRLAQEPFTQSKRTLDKLLESGKDQNGVEIKIKQFKEDDF